MAQRVESRVEAIARIRREFSSYSDDILLTEFESGAAIGFSHHSLKFWRLNQPARGPRAKYMHGMVRYSAGELRRWIEATQAESAA